MRISRINKADYLFFFKKRLDFFGPAENGWSAMFKRLNTLVPLRLKGTKDLSAEDAEKRRFIEPRRPRKTRR